MKKIFHISTVHPRRDTRIFYRECISLKNKGYDVTLIVADGKGLEKYEGVTIIDIGKSRNRVSNFFEGFFKIFKIINALKPDLVHFHDAELMIIAKIIQLKGIHVCYDIHENVAAQILDKSHIASYLRKPLHYLYKIIENILINSFHLIIAEKSYKNIYLGKGKSLTVVLNLPEESSFSSFTSEKRIENGIFYIGGISNERGLDTIIEALKILKNRKVNFFMHYIGAISEKSLSKIDTDGIQENLRFYGRMDLVEGYKISKKCKVGLAVLKPIENYVKSYPTKIFEYMSIKLPVITSNFELYKDVIEKNEAGFCIDPFSPIELANKIDLLLKDDNLVKTMGENGKKAIIQKFNYKQEEIKLYKIYSSILREKKSYYDF